MGEQLRYDGKVVIVTGAGNGLGRSHALMFAARGARVVVNDLGGNISGGGKSSAAADQVVDEIRALGGEAVANYDSVEEGAKIVQTAVDAFGTVDIVVNNAGILRDTSFHKMAPEDWQLIVRVHLNGSFSVTHAAWPILRDKGYGRIIMTTSAAGIYGNFGQANYSAAKLGLVGLANTLAQEGRSKNIHVNTIAPIAGSRLTETVMPPELVAQLKPEYVSPLVGWLCHEDCRETGGLFEVGAGYHAKLRWERTRGYSFRPGRAFESEDIVKQWGKLTDFDGSEHPANPTEALAALLGNLDAKSLGGNEFIDLDQAAAAETTVESSYDERDVSLYALGVGAAADPLDRRELALVYELNNGGQRVLPTYAVMPAMNVMLQLAKDGKAPLPGLNYGFDRVLHGEQYTEIKAPLPTHAKLTHSFKLKAAYDKAPNAVVVLAVTSRDEHGEEIAYNEITTFVRGAGGWGGERGPAGESQPLPERAPDVTIEEKTDPSQALLYRLSGDWNPLHADPDFAKAFGFDKPILHGLCTYGHVARHVVNGFLDGDPRRFKSIKVRFADSVFPGETLVTRMWRESPTRVLIETRVKERDAVVIKNAVAELYEQIPQRRAQNKAASQAAAPGGPTARHVFAAIARHLAATGNLGAQTKTVFEFKLSDPDSAWVLDLSSGDGSVREGAAEKSDVSIAMNEADFVAMSQGKADANKLYFGGKMKIGGNVMASQKLGFLAKMDPKLIDEAIAADTGAAAALPDAPAAASAPPAPACAANVFGALARRLNEQPERVNGLGGHLLQFRITEPDASWRVDLRAPAAKIEPGEADGAAATFVLSDGDLAALASGQAEVRDLFQRGRLGVDGDLRLARELGLLNRLI